jgi:hypothetical protein
MANRDVAYLFGSIEYKGKMYAPAEVFSMDEGDIRYCIANGIKVVPGSDVSDDMRQTLKGRAVETPQQVDTSDPFGQLAVVAPVTTAGAPVAVLETDAKDKSTKDK